MSFFFFSGGIKAELESAPRGPAIEAETVGEAGPCI